MNQNVIHASQFEDQKRNLFYFYEDTIELLFSFHLYVATKNAS